MSRLFWGLWLICSLAMLMFLVGFVLYQLGLGWVAALIFPLASRILLLAMGLLAVLAAAGVLKLLAGELKRYFSADAVALRQLLRLRIKSCDLKQQAAMEWRQLQYRNRFKRQRIMVANNRKHLRELFHAVNQELLTMKSQLPNARYQALHKALRRSHKQGDAQAILSVRGELSCR